MSAAFQKRNRGTLRTSPTPFQFLDEDCPVGIDTDLQPVRLVHRFIEARLRKGTPRLGVEHRSGINKVAGVSRDDSHRDIQALGHIKAQPKQRI